jgi:hypothetical protein
MMAWFGAAFTALAVLPGIASAEGIPLPDAAQLLAQQEAYDADRPKTIAELQPYRAEQRLTLPDETALTLTSLNPAVNAWYLLEVKPLNARKSAFYHLENVAPQDWQISLEPGEVPVLRLTSADKTELCPLTDEEGSVLEAAQKAGLPFAPICQHRLFLRNSVDGSRTSRERTAEFLRDHVWFGEAIVGIVKDTFYQDAFIETGEALDTTATGIVAEALGRAQLDDYPVISTSIGLPLEGTPPGGMAMGNWYAVTGAPGVYASTVRPGKISAEILKRPDETNWLDDVERRADAYLVAFDLSQFEIGYEVGTSHPTLNWSPRPSGAGRSYAIPGPDGVASSTPLITLGMVSPALAGRVAATFTGGYKREHGAFRMGDLAFTYYGHHYGFVVNGVVLSKLVPDLSTIYVLNDGTIGMRTWTEEDAALLPQIRFARQNGVPLIAPNPETGESVPGPLVRNWGPGNWSGSADAQLRTLRGGACMKTVEGRQLLIYGYFSTATPSAMARTFQAYGCDYAMLLDMNSIEHTYMALYTPKPDGGIDISHLVRSMKSIDSSERDGTPIPRFVGFPDNRDFFYLLRKGPVR